VIFLCPERFNRVSRENRKCVDKRLRDTSVMAPEIGCKCSAHAKDSSISSFQARKPASSSR